MKTIRETKTGAVRRRTNPAVVRRGETKTMVALEFTLGLSSAVGTSAQSRDWRRRLAKVAPAALGEMLARASGVSIQYTEAGGAFVAARLIAAVPRLPRLPRRWQAAGLVLETLSFK